MKNFRREAVRIPSAARRLFLRGYDLDRDVLQFLRLDDVAVEPGFLAMPP